MVYRYVNVAGEGGPAVAPGYFDIDTATTLLEGVTMADCGDVNVAPSNVDLGFERLTRSLESILDRGAFPVIVGGDHAVTVGTCGGTLLRRPRTDAMQYAQVSEVPGFRCLLEVGESGFEPAGRGNHGHLG